MLSLIKNKQHPSGYHAYSEVCSVEALSKPCSLSTDSNVRVLIRKQEQTFVGDCFTNARILDFSLFHVIVNQPFSNKQL